MLTIIKFILGSFRELVEEVTWPSAQELQRLSFLFLICLAICTAIVGGLNIYLQKVSVWFYNNF